MGILLNTTEFPSDQLLAVYHVYEYAIFVFTFVVVGYTLTVIFMTSAKGLSKYKWYLVHGLVWGICFDAMAGLIGAVTLFPIPCYYGINVSASIGGKLQMVYFFVGVNCAMGKAYATLIQFEYRFQQALPLDSWYRTRLGFLHGKYELTICVVFYCFILLTLYTPWIAYFPNQEDQRSFLSNMDPVVAMVYTRHPNTICFASGLSNLAVNIFAFWMFFYAFSEMTLLVFIHLSIHRQKLKAQTYRLQIMLFWSLTAQMAAFITFFVAPGILFLAGGSCGIRNMPRITVYCFFFFVTHTTVDSFLILYFIKPYRQAVFHVFGRYIDLKGIKIVYPRLYSSTAEATTVTVQGKKERPTPTPPHRNDLYPLCK
ncbi:unnamed protein product [Bursaphelenchus xylophilus]|uniref:(pine wood nematode) hypothetical protein n=1 Tax=Bursaphelenchus xylophilus TaxID=6326 RepID=A0A1I7RKA6_BURXY|nr:unnamed protein product [Bursaphelenchus xylophilus]CAG9131400.1 unnamed protein product [Bursaphelenchus xylophilus]